MNTASTVGINPGDEHSDDDLAEAIGVWQAGELERARTALQHVVNRRPDWAEAFLFLGMVQLELQDDAQAERTLAEAARLAPHEGVVHFRHAEALSHLGRFDEAVDALLRAIEQNPGEAKPYLALARVLGAGGERQAAIDVLAAGVAMLPADERLQEALVQIQGGVTTSSSRAS